MGASNFQDKEGGPYIFKTKVRGVSFDITLNMISTTLNMEVRTDGVEYLKAGIESLCVWMKVVNAVCLPGMLLAGNSFLSKELKSKYKFMNFIMVCNILPTMNTKVVLGVIIGYVFS